MLQQHTHLKQLPTTNPNVLWAEFHREAVAITTGCPYQQDYVLQLETKEGKVVRYREYSNPLPAMAAWGSTQDLRQYFSAK